MIDDYAFLFNCRWPIGPKSLWWLRPESCNQRVGVWCYVFSPAHSFSLTLAFSVIYALSRHPCVIKKAKWHMRPAKTQISLGLRPDWSESSLSAWRNLGSWATHWTHSEDSAGCSVSLLGEQVILLVLSCCGSYTQCRCTNWVRELLCKPNAHMIGTKYRKTSLNPDNCFPTDRSKAMALVLFVYSMILWCQATRFFS